MYDDTDRDEVVNTIKPVIAQHFEKSTVGARMINTLIHKYFIQNGVVEVDVIATPKPKSKLRFSKK
jgi:predicted transcriptional regulator